jgi:fatty acid-binding protein DegV
VLKQSASALARLGEQFPAVAKNVARIQASIKMLELNVSDLVHLEKSGRLPDM